MHIRSTPTGINSNRCFFKRDTAWFSFHHFYKIYSTKVKPTETECCREWWMRYAAPQKVCVTAEVTGVIALISLEILKHRSGKIQQLNACSWISLKFSWIISSVPGLLTNWVSNSSVGVRHCSSVDINDSVSLLHHCRTNSWAKC